MNQKYIHIHNMCLSSSSVHFNWGCCELLGQLYSYSEQCSNWALLCAWVRQQRMRLREGERNSEGKEAMRNFGEGVHWSPEKDEETVSKYKIIGTNHTSSYATDHSLQFSFFYDTMAAVFSFRSVGLSWESHLRFLMYHWMHDYVLCTRLNTLVWNVATYSLV